MNRIYLVGNDGVGAISLKVSPREDRDRAIRILEEFGYHLVTREEHGEALRRMERLNEQAFDREEEEYARQCRGEMPG